MQYLLQGILLLYLFFFFLSFYESLFNLQILKVFVSKNATWCLSGDTDSNTHTSINSLRFLARRLLIVAFVSDIRIQSVWKMETYQ